MSGLPANQSVAIEARSVTKIFGRGKSGFRALNNISVAIAENEFFTLLGPSGCGKTTLLRLIAGFEFPTEGQILLHGEDIAALPPYRRPVNTVFQNYALFPHLTVAQNISFGLEMLGKPSGERTEIVDNMLRLVKMEPMRDRLTSQISGGQQQRVALARALAPSPKVLLLDEPLSALDYKLRKEMQGELKRMQHETGITFIFVTHDQEEALAMSDRIAVMSSGEILQVGAPRDIYERPSNRFVADFIGETNFFQGQVESVQNGRAVVKLGDGTLLTAGLGAQVAPNSKVTIVIRPEHVRFVAPDAAEAITGAVDNVVYSGTDTHYTVRLADDTPFVVRSQNKGEAETITVGTRVGIALADNAARVLSD